MKVVIIGGGAGGAGAATRLRRLNEKATIILIEKGPYISYANCGLPYYVGNVISDRDDLFIQTPESFRERFRADVRVLHEIVDIDAVNKLLTIEKKETGEIYEESYDKLVLAPGAEPIRPPIPGLESDRIFTVRSVRDTDRIKSFISGSKAKTAVVAGGGFIGLEMAENLKHAGLEVTIVEMADQVMAGLDHSMVAEVHHHLVEKGVNLLLNRGITGFKETDREISVELNTGEVLETDIVIWSIGVRPDTKVARKAGLKIGKLGGIRVNPNLQTSDPDIYALGDAIEVVNLVTGKPALIPLAGPANKQARIVANNIVFENQYDYKGSIGTAIAKIFDMTVASAGVSAKGLKREGIPYLSAYVHASSHAGYYPGARPLSLKITFSPENGQLFGAQVIGSEGVDKRIEMLAQVIQRKGTVFDLSELEHAYAPPYSSAKDPVNMIGFIAENIYTGKMKTIRWNELRNEDFILDVRTALEFEEEHIENAVNIPLEELRSRLDSLPKDRRIIVYCAIGLRAYLAYRVLSQQGFEQVFGLSGGYKTFRTVTSAFGLPGGVS